MYRMKNEAGQVRLPWTMATGFNDHTCRTCLANRDKGLTTATPVSFAKVIYDRTGIYALGGKGFFKELRKEIVKHYKECHPEYEIVRLREGPK